MGLFDEITHTSDPSKLTKDDVLVVWGGADIPVQYYKKGRSSKSWAADMPTQRDVVEWSMCNRAAELGIPMIGVCRGAQMMCALAGGYLIQHVTGHGGQHIVETSDGQEFHTNSIHHQMMMPADAKHQLLASIPKPLSREYWDEDNLVNVDIEREYIYFDDIKAHAVQWHPEGMYIKSEANQFLAKKIKEFL
jgi:gamma-glutamyl-gamma-aminobutyrate hydrolase PuuD